jgi:TnpA family transposase
MRLALQILTAVAVNYSTLFIATVLIEKSIEKLRLQSDDEHCSTLDVD